MTVLAAMLRRDQAAALTALQALLITEPAPPAAAEPTAAVCPTCGAGRRAPAVVFRSAL